MKSMTGEDVIVPKHLGFILDGNRRWARQHAVPVFGGHLAGYRALKEVLRATFDMGVPYVTIYAFSTENWQRSSSEVSRIMRLVVHAVSNDLKEIIHDQVRLRFLGSTERLSSSVVKAIKKAEALTAHFTRRTLGICLNYGGQQELVDAMRRCVADGLAADAITAEAISARLYAPDIPSVDMVVRTSGEHRLSNFMLWRTTYSECLFLDKYWPDMTKDDVTAIIKEYNRRNRRFGV